MVSASRPTRSARVRSQLDHPVIDADGHADPLGPEYLDYLREFGGVELARRYESLLAAEPVMDRAMFGKWAEASVHERMDAWIARPAWWFFPTGITLDRATSKLPRLMHERLGEFGIDHSILYLNVLNLDYQHDELRRVSCRASNKYHADLYAEFSDRLTPAALIPMHTPEEALDELDYAVGELGMRAIQIAGYVRRPIPLLQRMYPELDHWRYSYRLDTFGIDSAYDYDPVWQRCIDLGVAPTSHSIAQGFPTRSSPSSYMYNHIGHFGEVGEALLKSLFFGGVTRRFPQLRVAALESGVGWACSLYAALIERWKKRNASAMLENLDPAALDLDQMTALIREYGGERVVARLAPIEAALKYSMQEHRPDELDEFSACEIASPEDIRDLFVPSFFFGCEADDPMNAWAFKSEVNPYGARLNAMFSSDITHWDVPRLDLVLGEAYEAVEREHMSGADFRDFVFTNAVRLHAGMNPDFFKGTACEAAAQAVLDDGMLQSNERASS